MRMPFLFTVLFTAAIIASVRGQELKPTPMQPRTAPATNGPVANEPVANSDVTPPSSVRSPDDLPRQPLPATPPASHPMPPDRVPSSGVPGGVPRSVPPATAHGAAPAGEGSEEPVSEVTSASRKLTDRLLSESLAYDASLQASPLPLVNALANVYDARRQLAVVEAYWNTSAALGNHFVRRKVLAHIEAITPRQADAAIVRSARAAAKASLSEAELLLQEARYQLAERVGLIPGGLLPIPSDKPHVGTYRTNADWMLPAAPVLSRARLIDRALPVRLQAIETRAAAVAEAEEALVAAMEAYHSDRIAIDPLLAFLRQYSGQYRAFLASVDEYNHNIVEYVVAVMQGPLPADRMVSMLIKPNREPIPFRRDPNVEPAGAVTRPDSAWRAQEPLRTTPGAPPASDPWANRPRADTPLSPRPSNTPTLAPPPDESLGQPPEAPRRRNWPTLAPRRADTGEPAALGAEGTTEPPAREPPAAREPAPLDELTDPAESSGPTPADSPNAESPRPTPAPPEEVRPGQADPRDAAPSEAPSEEPTEPRPEDASTRKVHTAFRQIQEESVYAGLAQLEPAGRAAQLAEILHWDRNVPEGIGHSITLAECLQRNLNPDRLDLVCAYWTARRYAAEYQLLFRAVDFLENIDAESAPGSLDTLDRFRLDTARLATKAALHETKAVLLAAQFDLTLADGHAFGSEWLYPSTSPAVAPPLAMEAPAVAAGPGVLQPHPGPAPVVLWSTANRASRRWSDLVAARHAEVLERAAAVVEADLARAEQMAQCRGGAGSLDTALNAHQRQMEETFAFLAAVTSYNVERAEVILQQFPLSGSTEELIRELGCK